MTIECVVNLSEGRDQAFLTELAQAAASRSCSISIAIRTTIDRSSPWPERPSAVTAGRAGVGPGERGPSRPRARITGPIRAGAWSMWCRSSPTPPAGCPAMTSSAVIARRDAFARWMSATLGVPTFLYGPLPGGGTRTLPQVRRDAFGNLAPDFGPAQTHPTAGATAVGARSVLVAYNVWVSSLEVARLVAPLVRGPAVRALGLAVGEGAQVSCNLVDPAAARPGPGLRRRAPAGRGGRRCRGRGRTGRVCSPRRCSGPFHAHAGPNSASAPTQTVEARLDRAA